MSKYEDRYLADTGHRALQRHQDVAKFIEWLAKDYLTLDGYGAAVEADALMEAWLKDTNPEQMLPEEYARGGAAFHFHTGNDKPYDDAA